MPTNPSPTITDRIPVPIPTRFVERVLRVDELRNVWRNAMQRSANSIYQRVLDELELSPEYRGAVSAIPASGPLVIVANHPFGIVEGPVLGAMLDGIREDVLFVTNSLLAELPELAPRILAVDPFGGASHQNAAVVRRALQHLRAGGALVVFPAGQVSAIRPSQGGVADAEWQPMAARLAMKARAQVVPVFFEGRNRAAFQLAGLVHPALRTMLLPTEMLARRKRAVRVAVGEPLAGEKYRDAEQLTAHLRRRTYALRSVLRQAPVAESGPREALEAEVAGLTPVLESGEYAVYLERAAMMPHALREIGRLREVTFRAAGEGSGRALDLDEFDRHYWHLFVWHRREREIVGGYRLADCGELPAKPGDYAATLFHFPATWRGVRAQAAELGRSFVAARYQKSFQPLLLLWKGIGVFVMQRPHLRYLYGPVSISADYSRASRAAIAGYFSRWPRGFRPRNPMTHALAMWPMGRRRNLEELETQVAAQEPDGKGLPVLLRHYLNLGGEVLCMNLDREFGDALDGLVLLDLKRTPEKQMVRYFGAEAANRFRV